MSETRTRTSVHMIHHTKRESALIRLIHGTLGKNQIRRALTELGAYYGEDDSKLLLAESLARINPVITIIFEKEVRCD